MCFNSPARLPAGLLPCFLPQARLRPMRRYTSPGCGKSAPKLPPATRKMPGPTTTQMCVEQARGAGLGRLARIPEVSAQA